VAAEGRFGLLPLSRRSGKLASVGNLPASASPIVADGTDPSQSTRLCELGAAQPAFRPMDSSSPRFASLSYGTLRRHTSKAEAVCVEALVRFCAGGAERSVSLPRQPDGSGLRDSLPSLVNRAPAFVDQNAPYCRNATAHASQYRQLTFPHRLHAGLSKWSFLTFSADRCAFGLQMPIVIGNRAPSAFADDGENVGKHTKRKDPFEKFYYNFYRWPVA
jgi:hypothetical protein